MRFIVLGRVSRDVLAGDPRIDLRHLGDESIRVRAAHGGLGVVLPGADSGGHAGRARARCWHRGWGRCGWLSARSCRTSRGSSSLGIRAICRSRSWGLRCVRVGSGLFSPSASALASKQATSRDRGAVMGTYQSGLSLARSLIPFASGAHLCGHRARVPRSWRARASPCPRPGSSGIRSGRRARLRPDERALDATAIRPRGRFRRLDGARRSGRRSRGSRPHSSVRLPPSEKRRALARSTPRTSWAGCRFDREGRLWAFDSQAFVVLTVARHGASADGGISGTRPFSNVNFC